MAGDDDIPIKLMYVVLINLYLYSGWLCIIYSNIAYMYETAANIFNFELMMILFAVVECWCLCVNFVLLYSNIFFLYYNCRYS